MMGIIIRKAKADDNLQGIVIQNEQPLLINHCPRIIYQKKYKNIYREGVGYNAEEFLMENI